MTSIVNEYVNLLDELTILCLHRVHYAKQFWRINEALLLYYFLHIMELILVKAQEKGV